MAIGTSTLPFRAKCFTDRLFILDRFGTLLIDACSFHMLPLVTDLFADLLIGLIMRGACVGSVHKGISVAWRLALKCGHHGRDE